VRHLLKTLRAARAINVPLTGLTRFALRVARREPRFAAKHLPRVGTTRAKLPDGSPLVLRSRGDDWVSNQVFWHDWSGYEPELSALFWESATEAAVTIDVGAHVGFYALLAARANPAGRVFAFEPLEATFGRLRRNLSLNGVENVEAVQAAAGATDARLPLFRTDAEVPCSASLSREFMVEEHARTHAIGEVYVPVVELDSFLKERTVDRLDLVKIDVDGYEAEVLSGLRDTIARDRPTIFCEVTSESGAITIAHDLRPLGYRFHLLTDEGPQERDSVEPDERWTNQLFATSE